MWDHKKLLNVVSHTPIEVNQLKNLQKTGDWVDVFRKHNPKESIFHGGRIGLKIGNYQIKVGG